ncbi:hypothetical protein QQ045_016695 [Rhodiola kirilowii]
MKGTETRPFFDASIKARRTQNTIKLIMDDGKTTEDADAIGLMVSTYFKNLFGLFPDPGDIELKNIIDPVITKEENDKLSEIPSMEEIKHNVFSMHLDSSPGPDGFNGKFFKSCWEIIKDDLFEAVCGFFEGLCLPKIISATNIVMIPKVHKASSLDQIRPISLCNFIHKIISKILNSRLNSVLNKVVSPE